MTTKKNSLKDKAPENSNAPEIQEVDQTTKEEAIATTKKKVDDLIKQLSEARQELKKLAGKQPKADKGNGVIMSILSIVTESGSKGISKAEILDKLTKLFPDKPKEGMQNTISVQLPNRMSKERGVNIIRENDKYMIK